jgi:hypothetical protein
MPTVQQQRERLISLLKIAEEKFGQSNAAKVTQLQKAYEDAVAQAKSFGAADPEQTAGLLRLLR